MKITVRQKCINKINNKLLYLLSQRERKAFLVLTQSMRQNRRPSSEKRNLKVLSSQRACHCYKRLFDYGQQLSALWTVVICRMTPCQEIRPSSHAAVTSTYRVHRWKQRVLTIAHTAAIRVLYTNYKGKLNPSLRQPTVKGDFIKRRK